MQKRNLLLITLSLTLLVGCNQKSSSITSSQTSESKTSSTQIKISEEKDKSSQDEKAKKQQEDKEKVEKEKKDQEEKAKKEQDEKEKIEKEKKDQEEKEDIIKTYNSLNLELKTILAATTVSQGVGGEPSHMMVYDYNEPGILYFYIAKYDPKAIGLPYVQISPIYKIAYDNDTITPIGAHSQDTSMNTAINTNPVSKVDLYEKYQAHPREFENASMKLKEFFSQSADQHLSDLYNLTN